MENKITTQIMTDEMTTIRVKKEIHAKILKCGKMGDSINDVMEKVLDYYIDRELKTKK